MSSVLEAPAVVAVVVTSDPGPWLETTLESLAAQDYPNLSVLVIDLASEVDPTPRVAAVLPNAYVRRRESNTGYSAGANEVLQAVEGASLLLFCHDDVALDSDALRLMVEEAYRSNAGVVAPKQVEWSDPSRLLRVGSAVDKTGVPVRTVEPGELDHEQHDGVRDVFVAPGGATLIRADLFATLGGFDEVITMCGEDLDFSWRAQLAGARVIVAPAARVRHVEAASHGQRSLRLPGAPRQGRPTELYLRGLRARHRLRILLKCYSRWHLIRVLPQALLVTVAEIVYGVLTAQFEVASAAAGAWTWNLRRLGSLRAARKDTQRHRVLPDSEVRQLQTPGISRFASFVRGQLGGDERARQVASAGRSVLDLLRTDSRLATSATLIVGVTWIVGARSLFGGVPHVGHFQPIPGIGELWSSAASVIPFRELTDSGPAQSAYGVLAFLSLPLWGRTGLLHTVLILGMFPLGVLGMFRLTKRLQSYRARLVGAFVYATVPVGFNALAEGRWLGLITYGAAPWVLNRLFSASALEPFAVPDEDQHGEAEDVAPSPVAVASASESLVPPEHVAPAGVPLEPAAVPLVVAAPTAYAAAETAVPESGPTRHPPGHFAGSTSQERRIHLIRDVLRVALVLGVLGALVPPGIAVAAVVAASFLAAGLILGKVRGSIRAIVVLLLGSACAAVLLFPATFNLVRSGFDWTVLGLDTRSGGSAPGLRDIFRLRSGPVGDSLLGYSFMIAATLPLLIGRGWRLGWAVRSWFVALGCMTALWAAHHRWVPRTDPEVLLAPAAVALAFSAALGALAFERDLPRFRFGLRQIATPIAALAIVLGCLPVLMGAGDGRWYQPSHDFDQNLQWMSSQARRGDFRVLWVGSPDVLPYQGWTVNEDMSFALTANGPADIRGLWLSKKSDAIDLIQRDLRLAGRAEVRRLGRLLAPAAVRYIVLTSSTGRDGDRQRANSFARALDSQFDLIRADEDEGIAVYENLSWQPRRSMLSSGLAAAAGSETIHALLTADTGKRAVALEVRKSNRHFEGSTTKGQLLVSEPFSERWRLKVGGDTISSSRAFGWANRFDVESSARASLTYATPWWHYLMLFAHWGSWLALLVALFRLRGVGERQAL